MSYKLYEGDCLELMNDLPDQSVDMILCDLPYGTTAYAYDKRIDLETLWGEYNRVIKPNGAILMFGSEPFSTMLRSSNIEHYKYDWIWVKNKTTGFVHAKNMPLKNYEIISVFSLGSMGHASTLGEKRMRYYPQGLQECNIKQNGKAKFGGVAGKRPSHKDEYVQKATGYPKMVLEFPVESKRVHPSQKPVALLEYLIKTYTLEGDTVLDNCMGGGSTGVACVNTGRNFIGMEIDPTYFASAQKRIEEAQGNDRCAES